jgi:type I restriction enzyme S subunit
LGLSISKQFIPSVANIIGTDMSTYRTIYKNQFAYGPLTLHIPVKVGSS